MALTVGSGPLGGAPAGVFNRDLDRNGLLYLEPLPRRIRGLADGETVVESRNVQMLHEQGRLPIHLFRRADIRTDRLEPRERRTSSQNKGEARWWHLRRSDGLVENAAWEWHAPPGGAPPLAGLFGFEWERWSTGSRKTSLRSAMPAIPTTASMRSRPPVTCESASTTRCSLRPTAPR